MGENFFEPDSREAKSLQKILKDKNSEYLKYTYEGEIQNGVPHTPDGYGLKIFEEQNRKNYTDAGLPYDLEMLKKYFSHRYARESFYFMGQRLSEKARYIKGKPNGAARLLIGIEGLDYQHHLYCNFKDSIIHGPSLLYESYRSTYELYVFNSGEIVETHDLQDEVWIVKAWKQDNALFHLMKEDGLDYHFNDIVSSIKN